MPIPDDVFANGAATAAMSYAFGQSATSEADHAARNRGGQKSSASAYSAEEQAKIAAEIDLAVDGIERQPFPSERAAAVALHEALDPISVRYDIEIGAFIHAGQGQFSDQFVVGPVDTQFLSDTVSFRRLGLDPTASYHTHGRWPPNHIGSDLARDIDLGVNGYISGAGQMLRFDYASRTYQTYKTWTGWE